MADDLARELALFRQALSLPSIGYSQVSEIEQLRALIARHPDQARHILDELEREALEFHSAADR